MNIKQLKQLIADSKLPDDAQVWARDRDCLGLDQVHVIGKELPELSWEISLEKYGAHVFFVAKPSDMYGGERLEEGGIKHALVFCDCD